MKKPPIYLDYNASAPLREEAWHAMETYLRSPYAAHNASAVHHYGREGRKVIERARTQIAALINADTNQVLFNSGATEANNTVLRHFANAFPNEKILFSAIEHPSISEASHFCPHTESVPVDENGALDLDALEKALQSEQKASLVSCQMVSNESGLIQDIEKISALAHRHGALMHCDATQSCGRIPVDMKALGVDFMTLSSHKIGGPQGVGVLALGLCGQTPTLLFGGGQEKSARAGTENVAGIVGFGAAAQAAKDNLETYQSLAEIRDEMEDRLCTITPSLVIHAKNTRRVANTSFFSLPGANSQSLLMAFDLEGIALSNGSACSSGSVKPSPTLKAMNVTEELSASALRVSIGWNTTTEEIAAFLFAWEKITQRLQTNQKRSSP